MSLRPFTIQDPVPLLISPSHLQQLTLAKLAGRSYATEADSIIAVKKANNSIDSKSNSGRSPSSSKKCLIFVINAIAKFSLIVEQTLTAVIIGGGLLSLASYYHLNKKLELLD
jgi:hypothetical protein